MEIVESTPASAIENFIYSCTELTDICFNVEELRSLGQFCVDVRETFKVQGDLSPSMKQLLNTDVVFSRYLPMIDTPTKNDYFAGIENIVVDIFKAICNFFKRIVTGMWDFIKKVFSLQKKTAEVNEKNLKLLRPYFEKHGHKLDKIPASSSIPKHGLALATLQRLHEVILKLTKMDINRISDQIHKLIKPEGSVTTIEIDYVSILGKAYVSDLKEIGITFDNESPVFETIYADVSTSSTIGGLGYDYASLIELNRVLIRSILPLKSQMERVVKTLDKISSELTQLSHKASKDDSNSDKYKEILETLPMQVTKLVGLFQKISLAIVTYETKTSDIIRCIYEDFRSYGDA